MALNNLSRVVRVVFIYSIGMWLEIGWLLDNVCTFCQFQPNLSQAGSWTFDRRESSQRCSTWTVLIQGACPTGLDLEREILYLRYAIVS